MISILQELSDKYFSCSIPEIGLATTGSRVSVTITIDGDIVYSEVLYPIDGYMVLRDLSNLVTPYAKQKLSVNFGLTMKVLDESGNVTFAISRSTDIVYASVDTSIDAETFCDTHFLSILLGSKVTALGRLEYLHYIGTDTATCTARYADGSTAQFGCVVSGGNDKYTTIDVSPARFTTDGKALIGYTVTAGARSQNFEIDPFCPDCAPILIFVNSFGCEELLYCTGVHKVAPTYKRSSSYISGLLKNYDIEETRTFKADTGILNTAMANWFDEVLRSDYVRVVNIVNGSPQVGKEVVITDSKSEISNADNELPRFTFSYQYAQRNHNVLNLARAGRIFDNTFDRTFN